MTDRIPLDHLTSDQYDELCDDRARLTRLRSLVGAAADEARGGVRDWLVDALAETSDPREPSTAHTLRQRADRAETALAEARRLHAQTCPHAQGAARPPAFTCSLCTALTAPARETT